MLLRLPDVLWLRVHNLAGPQTIKIGGEANGGMFEDVEILVDLQVDAEVEDAVVVVDVVVRGAALGRMTRWRVTAVGCVAIWPVTAPTICSHREVELPTLPVENLSNLCKKAHVAEAEEIGRSGSVASASSMMMRVTNTPSMMTDSCMCRWTLGRLLPMERMRRKIKKIQKTKKDVCQCGCKWHHIVFNWYRSTEKYKKCQGMLSVPDE